MFLSLAEPEHADARGHGTQVLAPEFGMRLGSFVDAWADSVGEISRGLCHRHCAGARMLEMVVHADAPNLRDKE